MTDTINLSGDYGYQAYKISGLDAGTTVSAGGATWIQDNDGRDGSSSPYPFAVYDAPGAILSGGTIIGEIDLSGDWRSVYNLGNSAAIRTEDASNVVVRDWRITDTWDAVRVSWNSPDFLIENVWVTNARDDAVENDRLQSGTIRDSLFDGVFGGISIDPSSSSPVDGHDNTVTLDSVLMRMKSFLYEGEMTHSAMIKTDSATDGEVTPNLRFINSVFAIENVEHRSYRSMLDAWSNTVESRGNVFLNLSDTALPSDYPMPPAGWTILQGQAAREYWEAAKSTWIANRGDGAAAEPPPPAVQPAPEPPPPTVQPAPELPPPTVQPVPEPTAPQPEADERATFSGVTFRGSSSSDTIIGNALDNKIEGRSGADLIKGGAGNDTIDAGNDGDTVYGGAGDDVFVFLRGGDMDGSGSVDIFMDFEQGADRFDLRAIDANSKIGGDQAFAFIGDQAFAGKTPGQLRAAYDAANDLTVVQLNTDNDAAPEQFFHLDGRHSLTASDFIL
ncbi:M10 family metallopeptidase C-terminal domain-containing protein [Falsiroseomonas sp. HC035]|uniref:M10 family metallopeptidase C-terminal domain-containing protein n=1 Tax=Falsiroseomonas sp. HC035 TaxID=3390999 RepID=UPI003D3170B0